MFERWAARRGSSHTQRADRRDVLSFVEFLISSLLSFYKYLAGAATKLRLPINVPNPAHAHFIARESSDPL